MRSRLWTGILLVGGGAALALAARTAGTLSINGSSVDTDFIVKNDRTYVPIADVAKALKLTITKTSTGYSLAAEGGANQVQGQAGKIGEVLNGGWCTVKVVKVIAGDTYKKLFTDGDVTAISDKEQIVAVVMRVKNATHAPVNFNPFGFDETCLVDNDEHSFVQLTGLDCDLADRGPTVLPGAAYDFALVFRVPKDANLTQLVYAPEFRAEHVPKKIFRIDLKQN